MEETEVRENAVSQNKHWWVPKVLPPFALLFVAFIPYDMGTAIFHFMLAIVFLVSLVTIIKTLRKKSMDMSARDRRLLRPAIAVSVVIIDIVLLLASSSMAERFAIQTARTADRACKESKECPGNPEGFICDNGDCRAEAGLTAKYLVKYSASKDKQAFGIAIRFSIDHSLSLEGGVAKPLTGSNVYDADFENKVEL